MFYFFPMPAHRVNTDFAHILTSDAPASFSNLMMAPIVVPRTMESSIRTILFPLKFSLRGPNFFSTASCLSRVLGWMKVLPTYLFLHRTSEYLILDWKKEKTFFFIHNGHVNIIINILVRKEKSCVIHKLWSIYDFPILSDCFNTTSSSKLWKKKMHKIY